MLDNLSRRSALKTLAAGTLGLTMATGPVAAGRHGLPAELAEVRSATAKYNDPRTAYADGYMVFGDSGVIPVEDIVDEAESICGMGFHFVDVAFAGALMSGDAAAIAAYFDGWDRTRPQVLAYGAAKKGLVLGAVEYIIPDSYPQFQDLFEYDDGAEQWEAGPFAGVHALHAWIHTKNPEGVFHPTNPRWQFSPDGCIGGHPE